MAEIADNPLSNQDGWKNLLTGLGIRGRDKTKSVRADVAPRLTDFDLLNIFMGDGLGSKVVKKKADDMVRAGWEVPGDEEGTLAKAQKNLGVKKVLAHALAMNRLFGGCVVMMDIANSGLPETPYNPERGRPGKLRSLKVFTSPRILFDVTDLGTDPTSPWFEEVERFRILKRYGGEFLVHRSRCLVFKGLPIPDTLDNGADYLDMYWGLSVLDPVFTYLSQYGALLQGFGHLGQEFSVSKLKLSNLEQMVAEGDYTAMEKRMEIIAMTKSLINAVLLGEGEDFNRDNITFSGAPEMLDRFMMALAGAAGYPVSILFGRSAAGLNATGESDTQAYYDDVRSLQETELEPELMKLLTVLNYGEGSPVKPEDLTLTFKPVWEPSQTEQATMRKTVAETDQIYVTMGAISAKEVRASRFANGYSTELTVDDDTEPEEFETDPEDDKKDALALKAAGQIALPPPPVEKGARREALPTPRAGGSKAGSAAPGTTPNNPVPEEDQ
jgi:phage-related protein (TIGR01555 family)